MQVRFGTGEGAVGGVEFVLGFVFGPGGVFGVILGLAKLFVQFTDFRLGTFTGGARPVVRLPRLALCGLLLAYPVPRILQGLAGALQFCLALPAAACGEFVLVPVPAAAPSRGWLPGPAQRWPHGYRRRG